MGDRKTPVESFYDRKVKLINDEEKSRRLQLLGQNIQLTRL